MSYGPAPRDVSWLNKTRQSQDPMMDRRQWRPNWSVPTTNGRMPQSNFRATDYQQPMYDERNGGGFQDGPNTFTTLLFDTIQRTASFAYRTLSFGGKDDSMGQHERKERDSPKTPQTMKSPYHQQPVVPPYAMGSHDHQMGQPPTPSFNFNGPPSPRIPAPVFTEPTGMSGGTNGMPTHQLTGESSLLSTPVNQRPPSSRGGASPQMESVLRALENTRIFTQEEADILKQRIDNMTRGSTPVEVDINVRNSGRRSQHRSQTGSRVPSGGYNRRTINFSSAASDRSSRSPTPPNRRRARGRSAYGSGASGLGGSSYRRRRKRRYHDADYYDEREHSSSHHRPPSRLTRSSSSYNFRHHPNKRRRLSRQEQLADERLDEMIFGTREEDRGRMKWNSASNRSSRKRSRTPPRRRRSSEGSDEASPNSSSGSPQSKVPRSSLAHSSPRHLVNKKKKSEKKGDADGDVEMNGRPSASQATNGDKAIDGHGFAFRNGGPPYVGGPQAPPIFANASDFPSLSRTTTAASNNAGSIRNSVDADVDVAVDVEGTDEKSEREEKTSDSSSQPGSFKFASGSELLTPVGSQSGFSFGGAATRTSNGDLSTIDEGGEQDDDEMTMETKEKVTEAPATKAAPTKKPSPPPLPPPATTKKPPELPYYAKVMKQRKARQRAEYVRRLDRIWGEHKPEKKGQAEAFLGKYLNERLHEVYDKACEKYNLKPHPEYQGHDSEFCPKSPEKPAPKKKADDDAPTNVVASTETIDKKDKEEDDDKPSTVTAPSFKFGTSEMKPFSLTSSTTTTTTTESTTVDKPATETTSFSNVSFNMKTTTTTSSTGDSESKPSLGGFNGFNSTASPFGTTNATSKDEGDGEQVKPFAFNPPKLNGTSTSSASFSTNSFQFGATKTEEKENGGTKEDAEKDSTKKPSGMFAPGTFPSTASTFSSSSLNGTPSTDSKPSFSFGSNSNGSGTATSSMSFGFNQGGKTGDTAKPFAFGGNVNGTSSLPAFGTMKARAEGGEEEKKAFGLQSPAKFGNNSFSTPAPTTTATSENKPFGTGGGFSFGSVPQNKSDGEKKEGGFGFGSTGSMGSTMTSSNTSMFGSTNGTATSAFNQSPFMNKSTGNGASSSLSFGSQPSSFGNGGGFGNGNSAFGAPKGNGGSGNGQGGFSTFGGGGFNAQSSSNNDTSSAFATPSFGGGGQNGAPGSFQFNSGNPSAPIGAANIFGKPKRKIVRAKRMK